MWSKLITRPSKEENIEDKYTPINYEEIRLRDIIRDRESELLDLTYHWKKFEEYNNSIGFSEDAYKNIQYRVSGRMAFLERSIKAHKEELDR